MQINRQQKNWNNVLSERIKDFWQRSAYLGFLDVALAKITLRFSQKN